MPLIRSRGSISGIRPGHSVNAAGSISRVATQHNCEPSVRGEGLQVVPTCGIELPKGEELRNGRVWKGRDHWLVIRGPRRRLAAWKLPWRWCRGVMRTPGVQMRSQDVFDDALQTSGVKVVLGGQVLQALSRVSMVADQEGEDSEKAVFSAGECGVVLSWGVGASGTVLHGVLLS